MSIESTQLLAVNASAAMMLATRKALFDPPSKLSVKGPTI
jgi:hypothetical protein